MTPTGSNPTLSSWSQARHRGGAAPLGNCDWGAPLPDNPAILPIPGGQNMAISFVVFERSQIDHSKHGEAGHGANGGIDE